MKRFTLILLTLLVLLPSCSPVPGAPMLNGDWYDYCKITPSSNLVDQSAAGTPVPPEAVKILTEGNLEAVKTMEFEIESPYGQSQDNITVVFTPVGFENDGARETMVKLTESLRANFAQANLDFVYVDRSIPIGINLLEYSANFVNWDEYYAFQSRIDSLFEHAVIVFVINANQGFAAAYGSEITISANTSYIDLTIAHEMGHIFGLDDGYQSYTAPESLPNNELWFEGNQPESLKAAASKVENPPAYQVGTCNGRPLYSYYDPKYNLMWSEMHYSGQPWGSIFTPIQNEIINQGIAEMLSK